MHKIRIYLTFACVGALLGGFLAIGGYWIFTPEVDSLFSFIGLRILIGAIVAMFVGPILAPDFAEIDMNGTD